MRNDIMAPIYSGYSYSITYLKNVPQMIVELMRASMPAPRTCWKKARDIDSSNTARTAFFESLSTARYELLDMMRALC